MGLVLSYVEAPEVLAALAMGTLPEPQLCEHHAQTRASVEIHMGPQEPRQWKPGNVLACGCEGSIVVVSFGYLMPPGQAGHCTDHCSMLISH